MSRYDLAVSTAATDSLQNLILQEIVETALDVTLDDPRVGIGVPFTIVLPRSEP